MNQASNAIATRWDDIDRAKGLGIFLVVAGHAVARDMPDGAEWFQVVKSAIYGFHMAFFMFISGFVFFSSRLLSRARENYGRYARSRVMRFMPAYLLFALLVWSAKTVAQNFVHVDNVSGDLSSLADIILRPTLSPASFLWYIWVLMFFHLVTPGLFRIRVPIVVWVFLSFTLLLLPTSYYFGLDKISHYFSFFLIGCLLADNADTYLGLLEKIWVPATIGFFLCLLWFDPHEYALILGLLSIPALHGLVRWGPLKSWTLLTLIGAASYSIYLMNTLAIGGIKAIILKFSNWDGSNFFWVLPVLIIGGLAIPMLVKKFVLSRIRWLDRITS